MVKKLLSILTVIFSTQASNATADCFSFKTVSAHYNNSSDYAAFIELKRTSDEKVFFISHERQGGFEQSTEIFNEVFNLTSSIDKYPRENDNDQIFDLKTSSITGEFSAFNYDELFICTTHYKVIPINSSIYFEKYQID